ncbi:MAG: hypothetical protein NTV21_08890 [Planctomycetota bacterium]|nr:hypothetical protein [Planctomycetota bacterium]
MALETHRRAMRSGLPRLVAALVLLGLSLAVPALAEPLGIPLPLWAARGVWATGALGSGAMLMGLLELARARVGGQGSAQLAAAFLLWCAELALRLYRASLEPGEGETVGLVELLCANAAMASLCGGMAWLLRAQRAPREAAIWLLPRVLFVLFLACAAALAAWVRLGDVDLALELDALAGSAATLWVLFLAPWAALVRALRAAVRVASRTQSTAEILTG